MNGTHFFYCKHKHIMKRGAPPYNVGSPEHLLPIEFHGLKAELI